MTSLQNFNENDLSFDDIYNTLKLHWKIIFFTPFLFATIAVMAAWFFVSPKYEVETTLYIDRLMENDSGHLITNFLSSPNFFNKISDTPFSISEKFLHKEFLVSLSSERIPSTNLINLKFETTKPELSKAILDEIFKVTSDYYQAIVDIYIEKLKTKISILEINNLKPKKNLQILDIQQPSLNEIFDLIYISSYIAEDLKKLSELKAALAEALSSKSQILIFDNFYVSNAPVSPNMSKIFLISFFFALIGVLLLVLMLKISRQKP